MASLMSIGVSIRDTFMAICVTLDLFYMVLS